MCLGGLLLAGGCAERPSLSGAAPSAEPPVLRFYNWEEYVSPSVLSNFTAATGIRVACETFSNEDEMQGRLRSQPERYDVIVVPDSSLAILAELQLLRPLEADRLPGITNLDARYLGRPADPEDRYSVPYFWGTVVLAYRRDKVRRPGESWALLWDPALAGRIMMLNDDLELYGVALLLLGYPLGTVDPAQLADAREKLLEQVPLVGRYDDTIAIRDALVSGACWAGCLYGGDAAQAAALNDNVVYLIPREGASLWVDNLVVSRDAAHPEAAHAFINYLLQPEVAAENANYLRYAPPNRAAWPLLDPGLREDPALWPTDEVLARCAYHRRRAQPYRRRINETWSEIRKRHRRLDARSGGPSP